MFNTLILFVIGFYILIKGANLLISGASSIARFFNISQWAIGIIIVGIGTSIPELAINVAGVFNGTNVGLGTVIGSNIFNILFVLGLSALISPLLIKREWIRRDFTFNILAIITAALMMYLPILGDQTFVGISRSEGVFLVILFLAWATYIGTRKTELIKKIDYRAFAFFTSAVMVIAGLVGVFFGGRWIVSGAELIAHSIGISDYLIGLTIVGIGTSIPELTVSLVAAFRKNTGIAIGNIIGSNIFDFLGILGIVATLRPLTVAGDVKFDILVTFGAAVLLLVSVFIGQRNILKRWEGGVFVLLYFLYLIVLLVR